MKLLTKALLTAALLVSSLFARPVRFGQATAFTINQISYVIPLQSMGNGIQMCLLVKVDQSGNVTYTIVFYSTVQG